MHLKNLNDRALTYCNKEFAYGGKCDNNSAWAMNASDFRKINGSELSSVSCIDIISERRTADYPYRRFGCAAWSYVCAGDDSAGDLQKCARPESLPGKMECKKSLRQAQTA